MSATYNVLFLCTGNSSRSILAEALVNHRGAPGFRAYSAGSEPAGRIHPGAIRQLEAAGFSTAGLRSKSWDEFASPTAPKMNFIFTLCDNAAREVCPVWPGHPATAHWGLPDPGCVALATGNEQRAFRDAFVTLDRRIGLLLTLPLASLNGSALQYRLSEIGRQ